MIHLLQWYSCPINILWFDPEENRSLGRDKTKHWKRKFEKKIQIIFLTLPIIITNIHFVDFKKLLNTYVNIKYMKIMVQMFIIIFWILVNQRCNLYMHLKVVQVTFNIFSWSVYGLSRVHCTKWCLLRFVSFVTKALPKTFLRHPWLEIIISY